MSEDDKSEMSDKSYNDDDDSESASGSENEEISSIDEKKDLIQESEQDSDVDDAATSVKKEELVTEGGYDDDVPSSSQQFDEAPSPIVELIPTEDDEVEVAASKPSKFKGINNTLGKFKQLKIKKPKKPKSKVRSFFHFSSLCFILIFSKAKDYLYQTGVHFH